MWKSVSVKDMIVSVEIVIFPCQEIAFVVPYMVVKSMVQCYQI